MTLSGHCHLRIGTRLGQTRSSGFDWGETFTAWDSKEVLSVLDSKGGSKTVWTHLG